MCGSAPSSGSGNEDRPEGVQVGTWSINLINKKESFKKIPRSQQSSKVLRKLCRFFVRQ